MFLPHTIGNGGESATQRRGRVPRRAGAGQKPDSGSNPPTSEAVRVHIDTGSEILREIKLGTVPRGVRGHCVFEWLGRCHGGPTAAIPSGRRCTQRSFTGSGVSKGEDRICYQSIITPRGIWQNTSVSFSGQSGVREMIHQFSLRNCRR